MQELAGHEEGTAARNLPFSARQFGVPLDELLWKEEHSPLIEGTPIKSGAPRSAFGTISVPQGITELPNTAECRTEHGLTDDRIPHIVEQMFCSLESEEGRYPVLLTYNCFTRLAALSIEGIFRHSGNFASVQRLREKIDKGNSLIIMLFFYA